MTLSALGIFSAAGAGGGPAGAGDYELIESYILGSSQSSVTFSSLGTYSSTYKHLQARLYISGSEYQRPYLRVNGATSGYSYHALTTRGTSAPTSYFGSDGSRIRLSQDLLPSSDNARSAIIVDVLDAFSTTKNKTFRVLSGNRGSTSGANSINLFSGLWASTNQITSLEFYGESDGFVGVNLTAGSRLSLYGIR